MPEPSGSIPALHPASAGLSRMPVPESRLHMQGCVEPAPPAREDIMTDATKRATPGGLSHTLAHVMAVMALVIIAACVFYVR